MQALTKSQKARSAIRILKTTADALALRGYYKPAGRSGQTLAEGLRMLSPEIYGSMNDPRIIELKGLEYVIDRLPRGIENCNRIILTAQEEFENTSFEKIIPPKRRRTSYRISEHEICFVITRGMSEIYDILTHITFLTIEAEKVHRQMKDREGNPTREWQQIEHLLDHPQTLSGDQLDQALWNLSIILGRTFHETKETFEYLEKYGETEKAANILFHFIHALGGRVEAETQSRDNELLITFTPCLRDMIGNQSYSRQWADNLKQALCRIGCERRPVHIISANLHSVLNTLYGFGAASENGAVETADNIYDFIRHLRSRQDGVKTFALGHGFHEVLDTSGSHIDCQIIDTARLEALPCHPDLCFKPETPDNGSAPVLIVIDYAFGAQAFEVMDELLDPLTDDGSSIQLDVRSISIMGKAGILPGKKGDIMLASAHVFEGTSDNYWVNNDLKPEDFDASATVYAGPLVTVVGTSLQNRDLLRRFQDSSWSAVGLEMEGGHYQKAISSAIIRGHIADTVKIRYAYYASDNPLESGQTLASGAMGEEGIKPTYMITKIILEKIFQQGSPAVNPL